MNPRHLLGAFTILIAAIGAAYSEETLEPGSFSIGGKLQFDYYAHRLGDKWGNYHSGYKGINYSYFYDANVSTSPSWSSIFGQTLYLDIGFRPFDRLTGDIGLEFIADYADHYWLPVNLEHRLKAENKSFSWNRADITYAVDQDNSLRYFRGVGHYNWKYEGDLFNLFPEQNDTEQYLRVSGRAIPDGWELKLNGNAGKLDLIYGNEVIWDYRNGFYANYANNFWGADFHLIYRDHIIPYGEPDERMRSAEVSTEMDIYGNPLELAVMYQPFRLNREYIYVEATTPGQGYLGSKYLRKTGVTGTADAMGYSTKLSLRPLSIFGQMTLQYSYRGLVAGNKQEVNALYSRQLSRTFMGSLEYTYRKPLLGPIPLVYQGTADNLGPAIFEPRGPESPFWVGWENGDTGWENREASIISAVVTFDPTPDTWFFKYDPNVLQDWNLNPEENADLSCSLKYTLSRYFTGTDRLLYWDENGHLLWESPLVATPWPTDGYIGSCNFLTKVLLPQWLLLFDIGFGESLAINSYAYTASTAREKPITDYFTFAMTAKTGPYTGKLQYNHDYWGPERWHRQFGEIYDDLYRLQLSRKFGEYITAGVEGTFARKDPNLYFAPELGQYDEIRAFLTLAFGPIIPYFGKEKPSTELLVGEAPEVDYTPPQVSLSVSTTGFTPNGDGYDDILDMEPWASDLSGIARWKIEIKDSDGQLVKTFTGEGQPPFSVEWDGKDDVYGKTVPEGEYVLTLTAVDEADNKATSSDVRVNVSIPPKIVTKEVIKEVTKEIQIKETQRGLQVSLTSRILFDTDKSNLKPSAGKTLQEVLKVLSAYPENKISIEGHTDSVGSAAYNQRLSERRAWSVANYLIKAGISSGRIKVIGFGEGKPVASNRTAAGREANRRVEVIILQ